MKVYCRNCKHFLVDFSGTYCIAEKKPNHVWGKGAPIYKVHCYPNDNFDCKDYKRKWWKVWVR